jgi:hypothetical protein
MNSSDYKKMKTQVLRFSILSSSSLMRQVVTTPTTTKVLKITQTPIIKVVIKAKAVVELWTIINSRRIKLDRL